MSAVAGDRAALPEVSPRRTRGMTAARVDAGDGLPLTIPALLRARAEARGDVRAARVRRRRASPTRTPSAAPPRSPAACSPRARARARTSGSSIPTGATSSSPGSRRRGSARSPSRSARSRPPPSSRVLLRNADVALLLARVVVPLARLRARRCATPSPELDLAIAAARCFAESLPVLRRIAFDRPGATSVDPSWSLRWLEECGRALDAAVLAAVEAEVHPGGPDGHRAHLGLDERAEGRDPHARRADPAPRQPEPAPPLHAGRGPVLQLAVLLDRRARLLAARHARRRRAGWCARTRPTRPACSTCSSASGRRW